MTTRNCFRLTSVALMAMAITFSACRSSKRAAREKETDTTTAASPQVSVDEHGITVTPQQGDDSAKNKKADKAAKSGKSKKSSVVARINENRQTARGIRGKMSIGLRMGDGTSLSASGSIKMKRDEIIQLSITALGLVELGRMELTPKYLFIQDRYHKRYLKSAWSDIPSLKSAGVDFNTFQALFWNELYVPGRSAEPSESDFLQSSSGLRAKLEPKDAPEAASLLFYTDEDQKLVYQTTLIARNGKLRLCGRTHIHPSAGRRVHGKYRHHTLRWQVHTGLPRGSAEGTPHVGRSLKECSKCTKKVHQKYTCTHRKHIKNPSKIHQTELRSR